MKKRPLSIVIIAFIYLLEPIGNLIQAAYINHLPFWGNNGILRHLIWSDWVILGLFPIVAVGVYMVRKWGWYLFVGFSVILISYNLYVYYFLNPNYQFQTVLFFIVIITVMSAFFFREHVYAPYFNPRLRWWEIASRYRVTLSANVLTGKGESEGNILDISRTGCFIDHSAELAEGDNLWLIINCAGVEISCLGKVVRKAMKKEAVNGYGILFQAMSRDSKQKIGRLIRLLESLGGKDREGNIPASHIPVNFHKKNYPFLNQLGLKVKSIFSPF